MDSDLTATPVSPAAARTLQQRLRTHVLTEDRFDAEPVRWVAGVDAHYDESRKVAWAAAVLLSFPELELVESVLASRPTDFPYIPGLLSFREAPVMVEALAALRRRPDLVLVDGQGIAHPRRFGLACHVGVLADRPAIGVAKSRLIGRHEEPPAGRGGWAPLIDRGATVGAVLRTRDGTRPLFVSPGHRVGQATAIELVLRCTAGYRLPEPTRLADRLSRAYRPLRTAG